MRQQRRDCGGSKRKPVCEVVAVPRHQPHAGTVAPGHDAEAVVLDFV